MPQKKKPIVRPKRSVPESFLPGVQEPRLSAKAEGNIRERKPAEAALQKNELRFRELTEFLPITIFEIDTSGKLVSFNQTALNTFRYSEEDFKEGMNALQFFPPEEWQRVQENLPMVIQGTSTIGQEFTLLRKDGSTFTGAVYATPIINEDKPSGIRGAIIDITEHNQTQMLQEAVYRIAAATETTLSLSELYHQIHQIISSVMPAENFYITLYDEVQNLLRFSYF